MNVIHKNEGAKIPYEITGNKICFDDDLTINLEKREEDWAVHIDICYGSDGELVIGAAAGRTYVAEIDIPKREYVAVETTEVAETDAADNGEMSSAPAMEAVLFDIDCITLSLWAIE